VCLQVAAAAAVINSLSIDGVDEDGTPQPFSSSEIFNAALERHFQVLEVRVWGRGDVTFGWWWWWWGRGVREEVVVRGQRVVVCEGGQGVCGVTNAALSGPGGGGRG